MDYIEINRFTQKRKVQESKDKLFDKRIDKIDALRLIVHACKHIYGISDTAKIIHALGVDKIDLSI